MAKWQYRSDKFKIYTLYTLSWDLISSLFGIPLSCESSLGLDDWTYPLNGRSAGSWGIVQTSVSYEAFIVVSKHVEVRPRAPNISHHHLYDV